MVYCKEGSKSKKYSVAVNQKSAGLVYVWSVVVIKSKILANERSMSSQSVLAFIGSVIILSIVTVPCSVGLIVRVGSAGGSVGTSRGSKI